MRSLVVLAVLAALSLPTLAAEQDCADKCGAEHAGCEAANCLPGRQACLAKCTDPKRIPICKVMCIKEFDPCTKSCVATLRTCLAACGQH